MLVGVAGGLGRYFGVDPVIFRIGFALSIFFGGLGALAYLLLALFVPTDGEPDRAQRLGAPPAARRLLARRSGWSRSALLAVCGLFALAGGAAFAVALGWGVPVAIAIIAIGAAARPGRAFAARRPLADPAGGGARARRAASRRRPTSTSAAGSASASTTRCRPPSIPADGYRLGVGQPRGRPARPRLEQGARRDASKVDLGAGQADVFVPRAGLRHGLHPRRRRRERGGRRAKRRSRRRPHRRRSSADAAPRDRREVDVGQLRVINSDTADVDDAATAPARSTRTPRRSAPRRRGRARRGEVDLVSLASGAVIAALGALVLLDSSGAIDLSLGWMAVALTGAVGRSCCSAGSPTAMQRHD